MSQPTEPRPDVCPKCGERQNELGGYDPCIIDEARWIDERNAGYVLMARQVLDGNDGSGMSDNECSQALRMVAELRKRIKSLESELAASRRDERDRLLLIVSQVRQQAFEQLAITSQLEVPWIVACDKIRDAVRRDQ